MASADKCFSDIVAALDAETLQGNVAQIVAGAAKRLVQNTGIDASKIMATFSPETRQTVQPFFA